MHGCEKGSIISNLNNLVCVHSNNDDLDLRSCKGT